MWQYVIVLQFPEMKTVMKLDLFSSCMWSHVVWKVGTSILEEPRASIFKLEEWLWSSKQHGSFRMLEHIYQTMRHYRKFPGLGQKRNAGLTYSIWAAISFKIVSLGTYTAISSFFTCFKRTVEIVFLHTVEYHWQFPLDVRHCFKTSYLQFHFQFGKQSDR
jgi:hypothetical protein